MTKSKSPKLGAKQIARMIEAATMDAYNESEQVTGFLTLIEEHLELPFVMRVLGQAVTVTKVDLSRSEEIVVICAQGKTRQAIGVLDLPLPDPRPAGAEWIEAYRYWRCA